MTDKIHLADGSTHFIDKRDGTKSDRTIIGAGDRLRFLNRQLEAQLAKTQTAAKFLAMKLDAIAKARLAFAQEERSEGDTAIDKFLEVIDEALTTTGMPES